MRKRSWDLQILTLTTAVQGHTRNQTTNEGSLLPPWGQFTAGRSWLYLI